MRIECIGLCLRYQLIPLVSFAREVLVFYTSVQNHCETIRLENFGQCQIQSDPGDPGLVQHLFLETSQINIFLPQRTLSRISVNDVLWACEQHTGADPGFPRRVASLKGGGTNILFCQNFQKTAWKIKNKEGASLATLHPSMKQLIWSAGNQIQHEISKISGIV